MKRFAFLLLLLPFTATADPFDDEDAEKKKDGPLAGVYHLVGREKKNYYGIMSVDQAKGSDIVYTTTVVNGGCTHGIGIVKDGVIALSWRQTFPEGTIGVTHYTLSKDQKVWKGVWAAPKTETPRTEQATFLRRIKELET